jgi:tetratricopeptide (TPR) repeat protein
MIPALRPAVVPALCLALAGWMAGQARWAEPYRQGRDAVKAGQYKEGIPLLERAVAIDRRQAAVKRIEGAFTTEYFPYYYLGVAYLRIGNLDKAEEAFRNAKSCECLTSELNGLLNKFEGDLRAARAKPTPGPDPVKPRGPDPNFLRQATEAEGALSGGRPADALRLFDTLRSLDPAEYARRGFAARRDEAARALAAELVRQGDELLRSGQLSAAQAKYEEAESVRPGSAQRGLDELGGRRAQYAKLKGGADADIKANRTDAALEKLKQAEAADPEQYQRDGLAARAQDLSRQAQGSSTAQKVRELIRRAQERVASRDYRAAVGFYGQALNADPGNAEATSWLQSNAQFEQMRDSGRTLYQEGQFSQALEALENARRQNEQRFTEEQLDQLIEAITRKLGDLPEDQVAPVREALIAYLQGDAARARSLLEAIAGGSAALDVRVRAHVFAWLGVTYADLSLTVRDEAERADLRARAMDQFRQLVAAQPDYQLRDSLISPRVRELLEEVRSKR